MTAAGGGCVLQACEESLQRLFRALDVDLDAFFAIEHPARQRVAVRQAVDEGAKAHALHDAAHTNGAGRFHFSCLAWITQPRPCQPI